jgi:lycopene elongase/hydratase (dihydrobisanhydrobacterioruberin-forming)
MLGDFIGVQYVVSFQKFQKLVRLSRPRFWVYVLGPYVVGVAASKHAENFLNPLVLLWAFYFIFPANLLIYGINDIFDYETDILNAKKRGYEDLVPPDDRKPLSIAIALTNIPFFISALWLPRGAQIALVCFLFLSIFYSAPPIRAKARPIIDAIFNALYICSGYIAWFLTGNTQISLPLLFAGWAWVMAMQAYSAVPDITADTESKTPTVATLLGVRGTLIFCLFLYITAAILSYPAITYLSLILGVVYIILILLSLRAGTEAGVLRLYRAFPIVNTLCGMALFFRVLL